MVERTPAWVERPRRLSKPRVVLDGGGKVALSGDGKVRILYLNTCDPTQNWPSSYCQDQTGPELTVQNLTFVDGNTNGQDLNGGGAIWFVGETAQSVLGIDSSTLRNNHDAMPGGQYPGVMAMGAVVPQDSTIQ